MNKSFLCYPLLYCHIQRNKPSIFVSARFHLPCVSGWTWNVTHLHSWVNLLQSCSSLFPWSLSFPSLPMSSVLYSVVITPFISLVHLHASFFASRWKWVVFMRVIYVSGSVVQPIRLLIPFNVVYFAQWQGLSIGGRHVWPRDRPISLRSYNDVILR